MKKFILFIVLFFMFTINVYANPYSQYETIDGIKLVNCTWYAWEQVHTNLGISLPSWGNAKNWYSKAKNAGYEVGSSPRNNSLVVYNINHVAYVLSYDGTYLTINDGGIIFEDWDGTKSAMNGTGIRTNSKVEQNDSTIIGYIYFDNPPTTTTTVAKETTTSTKKTTKKKTTTSTTTVTTTTTEETTTITKEATTTTTEVVKEQTKQSNRNLYIILIIVVILIIVGIISYKLKKKHKK